MSLGSGNQTTINGYDKTSLLTSVTDPRGGLYGYAYDGIKRLIRETDQGTAQVNYTLNAQGGATKYTDPRTLATTYVRNGFGDVIQRVSPDTGTTVYTFDARGLVTQMVDGRGNTVNYAYDNAGRMTGKTFPTAATENVAYTYDAITGGNFGVGRLTSLTDPSGSTAYVYDARGNVLTETHTIAGQAYVVAYAYDLADHVIQITYPSLVSPKPRRRLGLHRQLHARRAGPHHDRRDQAERNGGGDDNQQCLLNASIQRPTARMRAGCDFSKSGPLSRPGKGQAAAKKLTAPGQSAQALGSSLFRQLKTVEFDCWAGRTA